MSYQVPDRNLAIETSIGEADVRFYDVRQEPFAVYGLYNPRTEPDFKRMPDAVAAAVSAGVAKLARNTAGGRMRFCTDSRYVAIRAEMPLMCLMSHMAFTGSAGFDLYVDSPETGMSRFWRAFRPAADAKGGFESKVVFADRKRRWFTVNFPSYSNVRNLYIGLQQDAEVGAGMPYRSPLPVVYYGSSITQGACATRPGNAYQNIISRELGLDFLNFGFSGNGRGEDAMIDYLAGLPMLAFVSDYDHNAPGTAHLAQTHRRLYQAVRAAHPDIPYLMVSRTDDYSSNYGLRLDNRQAVLANFEQARAQGDGNVYYIDGGEIFRGPHEDQCTVDGTHPTDIGFSLMADAIGCALRQALMKNSI